MATLVSVLVAQLESKPIFLDEIVLSLC